MSEMIERVAKAIALQMDGDEGTSDAPFFQAAARAAIEAMREPSEPMTRIGARYLDADQGELTLSLVRSSYSAMIDAALK